MVVLSRCLTYTVARNCDQKPLVQVAAFPICDPLFSHAGAVVTLRSLEGTLYRVDTYTLRSNSGFFDTLLSLPQDEIRPSGHDGDPTITLKAGTILDVYENDFALKTLLSLMSGVPILDLETIHAFECVLYLAEKWDSLRAMDFLRSALISHRFTERYPLRCYRLATHFCWGTEAKLAASHSLTLDIFNPIHRDTLRHLSSKALLSLLNLHRTRQMMFRELLNCPERFVAGNSPCYCQRCGITELDNSTWRNFKNRMFLEMERRPIGDTVTMGAACWPEAQLCWEARCPKQDCGALCYDKIMTLRQIEACIALLPQTVEYED